MSKVFISNHEKLLRPLTGPTDCPACSNTGRSCMYCCGARHVRCSCEDATRCHNCKGTRLLQCPLCTKGGKTKTAAQLKPEHLDYCGCWKGVRLQCKECDGLGVFICGSCDGNGCDKCSRKGEESYVYCEDCIFRAERMNVQVFNLEKWLGFLENKRLLGNVMLEKDKSQERISFHANIKDIGGWENFDDNPGWI